jgi:type I restriction enzyme M protein
MIPACLWFVARDKQNNKFRDRRGETLFIDARKLGVMVDRRHRQLEPDNIKKIGDAYHAWRGEPIEGHQVEYEDVAGFCKTVKLEEMRKQGHILTPGRYVGTEEQEIDEESFEQKLKQLVNNYEEQMKKGQELDKQIMQSLKGIGF